MKCKKNSNQRYFYSTCRTKSAASHSGNSRILYIFSTAGGGSFLAIPHNSHFISEKKG